MNLITKRSDQEKVIIEMFHTIGITVIIFYVLPQIEHNRATHMLDVVLSFENMEEQCHSRFTSLIFSPGQ